jgi:hypothetical protein
VNTGSKRCGIVIPSAKAKQARTKGHYVLQALATATATHLNQLQDGCGASNQSIAENPFNHSPLTFAGETTAVLIALVHLLRHL